MPHQLDIFDDSRDVALRNDLAQALLDGDAANARRIADTLKAEFGVDRVLAPAERLIEHLRWRQSRAPAGGLDVTAVLQARQRIDDDVATAATAVMGARVAAPWLADQWRWLAGQAGRIGWYADHADAHAAALYLRAQAWQPAAEAVSSIASWRRIPVPLLWMAQARWRGDGAEAACPLLAEALWLTPARAAALLQTLADRNLNRLVERFEEHFEPAAGSGAEWAWLPAFVLVDQPALAGPLSSATPAPQGAPGEAFQVMLALLRLERQGRHPEIVAHRAHLNALSAPLFSAYMCTR